MANANPICERAQRTLYYTVTGQNPPGHVPPTLTPKIYILQELQELHLSVIISTK